MVACSVVNDVSGGGGDWWSCCDGGGVGYYDDERMKSFSDTGDSGVDGGAGKRGEFALVVLDVVVTAVVVIGCVSAA